MAVRLTFGIPYEMMGWIHDEIQISCPPEHADTAGDLLVKAANDAGTRLAFNMPVDAEYSIGKDWSECH